MNDGAIVEEGDHNSLISRQDGLYARLARLQFERGARGLSEEAAAAE